MQICYDNLILLGTLLMRSVAKIDSMLKESLKLQNVSNSEIDRHY
jgi:hypothetical protein